MKNSPDDARYYACKWLIEDVEGFYRSEIVDGKLIIKDLNLKLLLKNKGWTYEDEQRYIKEVSGMR